MILKIIQDAGRSIAEIQACRECWMLDAGCWMLDAKKFVYPGLISNGTICYCSQKLCYFQRIAGAISKNFTLEKIYHKDATIFMARG